MSKLSRRTFIQKSAKASMATLAWPALIEKALSVQANNINGSIEDVEHIVILMQENRSFDHYFGTMKGVRGFGDRFPIPLESGERIFYQTDGEKIVPPYRADKKASNAAFIKGTPHGWSDTQLAWNQGKYGCWPLYKTPYSMAYYTREEIPFQYALAESFTICDANHCSVTGATDPNRIVFFSGSNFDPEKRAAGINCTDQDSEPVNLRCWPKHAKGTKHPARMPEPGYTYRGNAFEWPTIPDVLENAGISWRIFQDPNDNYDGAMHGCLAFKSFRTAKPGSSIYENGMRHWSLEDMRSQVENDTLPQVCWVLPAKIDSEHPGAPSSPYRGGNFTHQILEALTSNPDVWSKTVFILTFDENDGLFDHVPAPAVPSYDSNGRLMGGSTLELAGMYFNNDKGTDSFDSPMHAADPKEGVEIPQDVYQEKEDTISGNLRPWGFGPRVPMYIISPWSKGGWVHSELTDHTSVGQFIEKRFKVQIPAISPWHRSVSSDLVSAFDFVRPNDPVFPKIPDTSHFNALDEASKLLPKASPPENPSPLYQEQGTRYSRSLPYRLNVGFSFPNKETIRLTFQNSGKSGVVFHVYDLNRLEQIPKRYTVEAGKNLSDDWKGFGNHGQYDIEVYGPNGYFRKFKGRTAATPILSRIQYDEKAGKLNLVVTHQGKSPIDGEIHSNAYDYPTIPIKRLQPSSSFTKSWNLSESGNWYDFTLQTDVDFLHRFAGRMETGENSISDPAMASELSQ